MQYFIVNFSVPSTINLLLLYFVEVEVVQVQEGEVHHIPIMRQVAQEVQVVQEGGHRGVDNTHLEGLLVCWVSMLELCLTISCY